MAHSTHYDDDITTSARARFAAGASIISLVFLAFVVMMLAYYSAIG
jgi:hypothetical protein